VHRLSVVATLDRFEDPSPRAPAGPMGDLGLEGREEGHNHDIVIGGAFATHAEKPPNSKANPPAMMGGVAKTMLEAEYFYIDYRQLQAFP